MNDELAVYAGVLMGLAVALALVLRALVLAYRSQGNGAQDELHRRLRADNDELQRQLETVARRVEGLERELANR